MTTISKTFTAEQFPILHRNLFKAGALEIIVALNVDFKLQ